MKTVQEWLLEYDEDELIDCYFAKYPIDFYMLENKDVKVRAVLDVSKENLRKFIHRLKGMDVHRSDDSIFYAVKILENSYEEISVELSYRKDILENDLPEHYGWEFTDHNEVLGYLIADTDLTRENMDSVLAEILYDMSFFGFTQEELEEERRKLEKAIAEIEEGRICPADEFFEKAFRDRDERSDELRFAVVTAGHKYAEYWCTREVLQIRSMLMAGQENAQR